MLNLNRFIEHTALKPTLTGKDIDKLVAEAIEHEFLGVCVPTFWVRKASREVINHGIQLVTVVGFPLGYQMTENKLDEIKLAIGNGANELDIVMNISAFKSGMSWMKTELAKCAQLIHDSNCLMKVIIETAYLSDEEIVNASILCQDAGTDFVKTSTGFAPSGAKVEHINSGKSHYFKVTRQDNSTAEVTIKINCTCTYMVAQGQANGLCVLMCLLRLER